MATLPVPSNPDATLKRGRDPAADAAGEPPSKLASLAVDVIFRVVVPHRQMGRVIGKQGTRIQQVRASTGATIKIADAVTNSRSEDRVIVISSKDVASGISSAESALVEIARLILTEKDKGTEAADGHETTNTIQLLIAGSQTGGLIGTSGQNIENIRNSSGASVSVLAQNQLPLCAGQESDRVAQVSGNVSEVLDALAKIGRILRENPSKEVISIKPRHAYGLAISKPHPFPPTYPPTYLPPYPLPYAPPALVDHVTAEMMILEKLVGGLIGKNGYNISKIRNESGATIKVSGVKGEGEQRLVQFSGSTFQVSLAKMMVDNYILSQLPPQNPF